MNSKRKSYLNLYYMGLSLAIIHRLITSSTLIFMSDIVNRIFILLIVGLFIVKIIADKRPKRELLVIVLISIFFIFAYIQVSDSFLLICYLAFIAFRGRDIRKVIKIDIFFKSVFLIFHILVYGLDCLLNYEAVQNSLFLTSNGVAHAFYFKNPNTVSMIYFWLLADIFYLKKNLKTIDILSGLISIILLFLFTDSRSALFMYAIFIVLYMLRNKRTIIHLIFRLSAPILAIASAITFMFMSHGTPAFYFLNSLTSNRLAFSMEAYSINGIVAVPTSMDPLTVKGIILDNFYTKCLLSYGLITLLIFLIPQFLMHKKQDAQTEIFLTVLNAYCLFEASPMFIGFSMVYLILAHDLDMQSKEGMAKKEIGNVEKASR